MHFDTKSYLKSNRYYTVKHTNTRKVLFPSQRLIQKVRKILILADLLT